MHKKTRRIWANAQRDGHPAEHMWRPLFNRSQPLVGRSSPYCGNICRTYCCL